MGRLTRDPEIRYSQGANSIAVARFSLAVDRKYKREGELDADFFNCSAFGKQAEFAEKYLHKGIKMVVIGRLQNNNYTGRNGERIYGFQVMVDELEFAESRNSSGGQGGYVGESRARNAADNDLDGFMSIPDDIDEELPFN